MNLLVLFNFKDGTAANILVLDFYRNFGGPKGTLIQSGLEDTDLDAADAAAELLGFYTTGLSPSYEEYERSLAIDALRTWAWSGPTETRPIWYLDSKVCDVDNPCEACQHRDHIIDPSICSKEKPCVACKFYNG